MAYSFTATVASRDYHVYKNTSSANAKVGEKVTVEMGTCAIKIKSRFCDSLIT